MDSELVNDSLSREGEENTSPPSYTEIFIKLFPYYLSIGMTEFQYWDGDCVLTKYYREAEKLKTERFNQFMWIQGKYIYDALLCVSPLLHAFAKKGTKAREYLDYPYALTDKEAKRREAEREKKQFDKNFEKMKRIMQNANKKLKKGGNNHGRGTGEHTQS